MSNQLVWQDRFNIGVDFIDQEHKKLFSILNKLLANRNKDGKSQWVCQEGIKYFKEHAMRHFSEEEAYMASISYAGYETHRRLHDNFRKKTIPALEKELKQTKYSEDAINHFLGVCSGWLIGHTLTEDHAITGKTMSKWAGLMPEEEQSAIEKTIIQLLYDMFRLDSKVISACYGGEKFGEGIYYRLVYSTGQDEKWELILVFEEKLILNTIGGMMDDQPGTVNAFLVNAARYVSRQFAERLRECLASSDILEIKEENLLSYDQFQKKFENELPQCSLLLNTGEGYFAFCVMAPHLLQNEGGVAIQTENAMDEVKKYLEKNKSSLKKKILIVDDSAVMRKAMSELLKKDYEIATVNSGMAAIRSITLNRPNLVLLDYEMPVCDGCQGLEMIRSEEDFADIPVIFLTGSMDKEKVKRAVALKPEGYLLKTLPPAEIKKNIDQHFKK